MSSSQDAGDSAKLREALKELQSRLVAGVHDGSIDCHAALEVVEKALAAPPRNCDVYQNKKDAEVAFLSEKCRHPCGNCTVSNASAEYGCALVHKCGVEWLFALATERKGGEK